MHIVLVANLNRLITKESTLVLLKQIYKDREHITVGGDHVDIMVQKESSCISIWMVRRCRKLALLNYLEIDEEYLSELLDSAKFNDSLKLSQPPLSNSF